MRPLKVLYAGLHHDYGLPDRGPSFEYVNLYDSLVRMDGGAHAVVEFPVDVHLAAKGRPGLNAELVEVARRERPGVLFVVMFKDELDGAAVREVARLGAVTIAWFSDDHWRFEGYSRHQAPFYDWCVTTDSRAPAKYRRMGYDHVIRSQWGCNHFRYRPEPGPQVADVSFVGMAHGTRGKIVGGLRARGLAVECFGLGWPAGRVSQEEMIRIFSRSRISLNLTNASGGVTLRNVGACVLERQPDRSFRVRRPGEIATRVRELLMKRREQIKGRTFEIPGCGGFQLCGRADDLETYFTDGKEIALYGDGRELEEKIRYYLAHEEERARVAQAGYERTLREHTYEQRFREVFRAAGVGEAR